MSSPRSAKPQPVANSVLAALPPRTYRDLLSGLEPVTLAFGEALYEPGEPIRDVYFPTGSLVSLLTLVERRLAPEVGLVGREGIVGVALALGLGVSPVRALVKGSATAPRLQRRKLIAYRRGNITILDHGGLETASCACYAIVKHMRDGKHKARSAAFAGRA